MGRLHLQACSQELKDVSRQAGGGGLRWAVRGTSVAATGGARATPHHLYQAAHNSLQQGGRDLQTGVCPRAPEPADLLMWRMLCSEHSAEPLRQWVSDGLGMRLLRAAILNRSGFGTLPSPLNGCDPNHGTFSSS